MFSVCCIAIYCIVMDLLSFMFQTVVASKLDTVRLSKIQSRALTVGSASVRNVYVTHQLNNNCRLLSVQTRKVMNNKEEEAFSTTVSSISIPISITPYHILFPFSISSSISIIRYKQRKPPPETINKLLTRSTIAASIRPFRQVKPVPERFSSEV